MKIIILSKTNYKEKDCIYNALSENEFFSFQAKGAQDNKSPFVWLNNQLTVADIELMEDGRYKHKLLKTASLVATPFESGSSFEHLVTISALAEITKSVLLDEEKPLLFADLLEAMEALKTGKDPLMILLIFIARALRKAGTELEVDKCVSCGTTHDIVAFSFSDGGFLCRNCINQETKFDLLPKQMKLVRYAFKAKDYSCYKSEEYESTDKIYVINKFKEFIDEYLGVNLTSLNLLLK